MVTIDTKQRSHDISGYDELHLHTNIRTGRMCNDSNDGDSSKSEYDTIIYAVRPILSGIHASCLPNDIEQWNSGKLVTINNQYSFSGNNGLYVYTDINSTIGMCDWYNDEYNGNDFTYGSNIGDDDSM